jgi:hypothetical protein
MAHLIEQVDAMVRKQGYAGVGDRIVIAAGATVASPGSMNGIIIHTLGQEWQAETEGYPRLTVQTAE